MSDRPSEHPEELTLLRFLDDALPRERAESLRRHVVGCTSCRARFDALTLETELIRAALVEHDEALPELLRPRQQDWSWLVVALIALGTLGASSLWTRFVTPVVEGLSSLGIEGTGVAATVFIQGLLWRGWSDMFVQITEGCLVLVAAGLATYGLHRTWRRFGSSVAALPLLVSAALLLGPAESQAAVIELDAEAYRLAADERIDTDLIVAGRRIVIEGFVAGDLIVAAANVEVSGEVGGDILGFAETLVVSGRVGGNVRAAGRSIDLSGVVMRNVTAGGETVRLRPSGSVGGGVIAGGREVIVDGPVERDVIVGAEQTSINSRVGGTSVIAGRATSLGPQAVLSDTVRIWGHEEPRIDEAASLAVPVDFERIEDDEERSATDHLSSFFFMWAAAFLFGAAVLLLLPDASEEIVTRHVSDYGRSLVHGALGVPVVLVTSVLLLITLVGLPLGALGLVFLVFGIYAGQTFVGTFIGREILGTPQSVPQALVRLALGLFLVLIVKALPWVSILATLLVAIWGFGSLAAFLRHRVAPGGRTGSEEAA